MASTTAQRVIAHIERAGLHCKQEASGQYRSNSPFRADSDSRAFTFTVNGDGEHGAWHDKVTDERGSLYDLAQRLGIEAGATVQDTKRPYTNLADYAKAHGIEPDVLLAFGWEETTYQERPALVYKTATGPRYRFTDGDKPVYKPGFEDGHATPACWYGLSRALELNAGLPLVLCNGEISAIAGQTRGIPAIAITGGERALPEDLLAELKTAYSGSLWIALDCDATGKRVAEQIAEQWPDSVILDLGLSDGGDLADFCLLHGKDGKAKLKALVPQPDRAESQKWFVHATELMTPFLDFVNGETEIFGRSVRIPFAALRRAGGFAEYMSTGKVMIIGTQSGGGKTILGETLTDAFCRQGNGVIFTSPEWKPMELYARMIQRNHRESMPVIGYMDFVRHREREAIFTPEQEQQIAWVTRDLRQWQMLPHYLDARNEQAHVLDIYTYLERVSEYVEQVRKSGQRIDVLILDYISVLPMPAGTSAANEEEYKLKLFKQYCQRLDVAGITFSQVTKEARKRVHEYGGFYNAHDLYSIREDAGNLILTANWHMLTYSERLAELDLYDPQEAERIRDEVGTSKSVMMRPYLDQNGVATYTPNFALYVCKNSVHSSDKYFWFHFDWQRIRVMEQAHPDYVVDQNRNRPILKGRRAA